MCGAIGMVTDSPEVEELLRFLQIRFHGDSNFDIRPNARIPIAVGSLDGPVLHMANWWLFQQRTLFGYTYDKRYRSFNTRADSLWGRRRTEFASCRCVVPASFFCEWKGSRYRIEPVEGAIAFGGLYKIWPEHPMEKHTQQVSCSIITLPPNRQFSHIHSKSFPLMLRRDEIERWLDPKHKDVEAWRPVLQSKIRFDLRVTPVDRNDARNETGPSEVLRAEA